MEVVQLSKREVRLHIRLTLEEKIKLLVEANEVGLSVSDFVRRKALNSKPLIKRADPQHAALIVGLGQLGKIGSNVNQIAHVLNKDGIIGREHSILEKQIADTLVGVQVLSTELYKLSKRWSRKDG